MTPETIDSFADFHIVCQVSAATSQNTDYSARLNRYSTASTATSPPSRRLPRTLQSRLTVAPRRVDGCQDGVDSSSAHLGERLKPQPGAIFDLGVLDEVRRERERQNTLREGMEASAETPRCCGGIAAASVFGRAAGTFALTALWLATARQGSHCAISAGSSFRASAGRGSSMTHEEGGAKSEGVKVLVRGWARPDSRFR